MATTRDNLEGETIEELVALSLQRGKVIRAINVVFNDALIEARKRTCDMDDPVEQYCVTLDVLLAKMKERRTQFPIVGPLA